MPRHLEAGAEKWAMTISFCGIRINIAQKEGKLSLCLRKHDTMKAHRDFTV
jgi:hypothetical protein